MADLYGVFTCIRLWHFNALPCANVMSHALHLNGRSPVCKWKEFVLLYKKLAFVRKCSSTIHNVMVSVRSRMPIKHSRKGFYVGDSQVNSLPVIASSQYNRRNYHVDTFNSPWSMETHRLAKYCHGQLLHSPRRNLRVFVDDISAAVR